MINNFAIFIMVWGRPEKMWTSNSLRKAGYTGKIYYVADNLDPTVNQYKEKYKDDLLVFDKNIAARKMDSGDNSGDLRSTLYSANTIFDLAKKRNIKYFMIMCDDYTEFEHDHDENLSFKRIKIKSMDNVIEALIEFYKTTPTTSIAFAQGGDFIGGTKGVRSDIQLLRKAMNSFLCSTDRPFQFMGRLNEDVTTYINLGGKGKLFFSTTSVSVIQTEHQSQKSGLTDVYLDYGTYVKSFFTVMYNPSCVKVSQVGTAHPRIHHLINWNNAVPKILDESYKKLVKS